MIKKILVIGSINDDLVFHINNAPIAGETITAKSVQHFLGGKGANQAVALAKLGANVSMFGKVGDDQSGADFINQLNEYGVKTKYVLQNKSTPTGCANILLESNGQNRIILFQGANGSFEKNDLDLLEKIIDDFDIVLIQLEINKEFIYNCINLIYTKNKYLVLNPGPALELDLDIIKKCDLIIPNEIELFKIFGKKYLSNLIEIKDFAKKVVKDYDLKLIVTLGENGSIYVDKNNYIEQKALTVKVLDTTAAGDTFIGALLSKLSQDFKIKEAMEFATLASSICVTKMGATNSIPTLEELEKLG